MVSNMRAIVIIAQKFRKILEGDVIYDSESS